jgi:hypothetical protein
VDSPPEPPPARTPSEAETASAETIGETAIASSQTDSTVPSGIGAVTPPALGEEVPAQLEPEERTELLAAIERQVAAVDCSRLEASLSRDGIVTLTGHVPAAEDLEALRAGFLALDPVEQVLDDRVEIYDRPFCEVIGLLSDATRGASGSAREPSIVFNKPVPLYREGEYVVVTTMNNNPLEGYVYLDYVDAAGDVVHTLPTPEEPKNRVGAWGEVVVGAEDENTCLQRQCYEASPPHGRGLVIAVWSRKPLFSKPRSEVIEPATGYFSSLADAMRRAIASGSGDVALIYRFLETRP